MIDTALAYLYSLPPLLAAVIGTVGLLYMGTVAWCFLRVLEIILDSDRVKERAWLMVRYMYHATRYRIARWEWATRPPVVYSVGCRVAVRRGYQYGPRVRLRTGVWMR